MSPVFNFNNLHFLSSSSLLLSLSSISNFFSEKKCKRAKQPHKLRSRQRAKLRRREAEACMANQDAVINEGNQFVEFWQPLTIMQTPIQEPLPEPVQEPAPVQVPVPVSAPEYKPGWQKQRGVSLWNEGRHRNDRHKAWHFPCLKEFEIIVLGKIEFKL